MAGDTMVRIRLKIGKMAAKINRRAALFLEVHRLRLEAGNIRAEAAQTEKEIQKLISEAAFKAYRLWNEGEDWEEVMKASFLQVLELEQDIAEQREDIEHLEETVEELQSIRERERFSGEKNVAEKASETEKDEGTEQETVTAEEKEVEEETEKEEAKAAEVVMETEEETENIMAEGMKEQKKSAKPSVCPACGAVYGKQVKYCRRCGAAVTISETLSADTERDAK